MNGIENMSDVILLTASNNKPGRSILHPLEFMNKILGCSCKQRFTTVQFLENKCRNQRFGHITGKVLTNGGNATQFYVGRCAGIGDMIVQSKITAICNAQVFNLACEFNV